MPKRISSHSSELNARVVDAFVFEPQPTCRHLILKHLLIPRDQRRSRTIKSSQEFTHATKLRYDTEGAWPSSKVSCTLLSILRKY